MQFPISNQLCGFSCQELSNVLVAEVRIILLHPVTAVWDVSEGERKTT